MNDLYSDPTAGVNNDVQHSNIKVSPTFYELRRRSITLPNLFVPPKCEEDSSQNNLESSNENKTMDKMYNFTNILHKPPDFCLTQSIPKEEMKSQTGFENTNIRKENANLEKNKIVLEKEENMRDILYEEKDYMKEQKENKYKMETSANLDIYKGENNREYKNQNSQTLNNLRSPTETFQLEIPKVNNKHRSRRTSNKFYIPIRRSKNVEQNYIYRKKIPNIFEKSKTIKSKQTNEDLPFSPTRDNELLRIQTSIKSLTLMNKNILQKLESHETRRRGQDKGLYRGSTVLKW